MVSIPSLLLVDFDGAEDQSPDSFGDVEVGVEIDGGSGFVDQHLVAEDLSPGQGVVEQDVGEDPETPHIAFDGVVLVLENLDGSVVG